MDECKKSDSPCGSNTDSVIEKFRFELTKKSDEDLLNIKKLTIQASNKSRESSSSNRDIDKKISDLECLILRLQEELNDLSSASKQMKDVKEEDECEFDYCCPVVNEYEELVCPEEHESCPQDNECDNSDTIEDSCDISCELPNNQIDESVSVKESKSRSANNPYPIILRDIGHVQEDADEDINMLNEAILINNEQPTDNEENNPNIKDFMFHDWENKVTKNEVKEEIKPNNESESISNMIAELRAEMDETLHTLNTE